jgi:hypothetical protein
MSIYGKFFKKVLKEDGAGYVPSAPNTAGNGGALGNAASIGASGYASGTPGTDTYAKKDARTPTSIFGGTLTRNGLKKKKKKKK